MTVRAHILDAGNLFGRRRPAVQRAVDAAVRYVERRSPRLDADLVVQPMSFGRDHFPIEAFAMSPHNVHVGIERTSLSADDMGAEVYRTVIHELHHAVRWSHVPRWTLGEAIILEGLAVVADQVAAGPREDLLRPMRDAARAVDYLLAHRSEPLRGHQKWLYSTEPEQPGDATRIYTAGLHVMRAALTTLRVSPWKAATRSADDLLDAGFARLGAA